MPSGASRSSRASSPRSGLCRRHSHALTVASHGRTHAAPRGPADCVPTCPCNIATRAHPVAAARPPSPPSRTCRGPNSPTRYRRTASWAACSTLRVPTCGALRDRRRSPRDALALRDRGYTRGRVWVRYCTVNRAIRISLLLSGLAAQPSRRQPSAATPGCKRIVATVISHLPFRFGRCCSRLGAREFIWMNSRRNTVWRAASSSQDGLAAS